MSELTEFEKELRKPKVKPDSANRRKDFAKRRDCWCCQNEHPRVNAANEPALPDGEELCFDCNFINCQREGVGQK